MGARTSPLLLPLISPARAHAPGRRTRPFARERLALDCPHLLTTTAVVASISEAAGARAALAVLPCPVFTLQIPSARSSETTTPHRQKLLLALQEKQSVISE